MADIEKFLSEGGYSDQTILIYRYYLSLLASAFPDLANLDAANFQKWLLGQKWGKSTRYLAACAARAYLKWRYGAKHPALAYRVRRREPPPQRTLTADEVQNLYQSFPSDDRGRRDLAMLSVFLDTGLRASEICRLSLDHLHLEEKYLSVEVKGGDWADKSFCLITAMDLDNWLIVRDFHAFDGLDAVFVSLGGNTPGKPLTRDGLRAIVRGWGNRAGLEHISPHAFRRTAATLGAEDGASDQLLMQQFGWKSASMVRRYTKRLRNRAFADRHSPVSKTRS